MRSKQGYITRGFTLVELMVSVSVSAVLMGGITSAMLLASHAIPDGKSANDAVLQGYNIAEQIVGELYCAQSFTLRTPTAVEFTVADRDNPPDGNPETIRYEWSGTSGDPFTRRYNAAAVVSIVDDVHEFDLAYYTKTLSETTLQQETTWTAEAVLAWSTGWDGFVPTYQVQPINGTNWASQYFEIVAPPGATQLKITRGSVMLQHMGTVPADLSLGIYRSIGDGTYIPDTTPIGTPTAIPGGGIATQLLWFNMTFSDVIINNLAQTNYCLVLKGNGSIPAYVRFMYNKNAPNDGTFLRWTSDGGASWDPRANQLNQNDMAFYVQGSFATTAEQEVTTNRYFLTSVDLTVRVGADPAAQVRTGSQIVNAPEVASP